MGYIKLMEDILLNELLFRCVYKLHKYSYIYVWTWFWKQIKCIEFYDFNTDPSSYL